MLKIAHIINPFFADESSDLSVAQPITFETMRIAKGFAREEVCVSLFTAQYPEDRVLIPEWFQSTPDLDRSILDFGTFKEQLRLPLLKDILDRLYEASTDSEYFIYTNVDIALMPHFYLAVAGIIETGHDAFVINRRTISKAYTSLGQLHLMFAQAGAKHPGYDCFVFKRSLYPRFTLGTACIGAGWVGRVLVASMAIDSSSFRVFEDLHLTFHIGDDRRWLDPLCIDYLKHNEEELRRILLEYDASGRLRGKPFVRTFFDDIERFTTRSGANERSTRISRVKKCGERLLANMKSIRRQSRQ